MQIEGKVVFGPELHFTPSGEAVCEFRIQTEDDSLRVTTWRELAEQVNQNLKVGMKVKVFGSEKTRWYTDRNGNKRTYDYINANRVQVLREEEEEH